MDKQPKQPTAAQKRILERLSKGGEILAQHVNAAGYLNVTYKNGSTFAPIKEICYGQQGGVHLETWYKGLDQHGKPTGVVKEWSRVRGRII